MNESQLQMNELVQRIFGSSLGSLHTWNCLNLNKSTSIWSQFWRFTGRPHNFEYRPSSVIHLFATKWNYFVIPIWQLCSTHRNMTNTTALQCDIWLHAGKCSSCWKWRLLCYLNTYQSERGSDPSWPAWRSALWHHQKWASATEMKESQLPDEARCIENSQCAGPCWCTHSGNTAPVWQSWLGQALSGRNRHAHN